MKKIGLIVSIVCITTLAGFSQGTLKGLLTDKDTGEPMLFANVILYQGDVFVAGVHTDFDGNYELVNVPAGVYDLVLQYVGYSEQRIEGVVIQEGEMLVKDLYMTQDIICCCCYIPFFLSNPLISNGDEFGGTTTFQLDKRGLIRQ